VISTIGDPGGVVNGRACGKAACEGLDGELSLIAGGVAVREADDSVVVFGGEAL
jgi:hypothetical protein